jgi:hypothetical protein
MDHAMADVIQFPRRDRDQRRRDETKALRERARGRTMCDRGFHKWSTDPHTRFDVRQGRLVTVTRCRRCDAVRSELR